MKKIICMLFIWMLAAGCAIPIGYSKFTMIQPTDNQSIKNDTIRHTDNQIDIIFTILKDSMFAGVESDGFSQYWQYRAITFTLINKTDSIITIDWNKISFKDYLGNSGAIMHQGMKYNECSNMKAVSMVPPKGKWADAITPCSSLRFVAAGSMSRWESSMLPSPRILSKPQFGIFMPLQIGDKIINYTFDFQAEAEVKQ